MVAEIVTVNQHFLSPDKKHRFVMMPELVKRCKVHVIYWYKLKQSFIKFGVLGFMRAGICNKRFGRAFQNCHGLRSLLHVPVS
jgi:hypothetical protein